MLEKGREKERRGRGVLLSSSSPFLPACSIYFHGAPRMKDVKAFEEKSKIKVRSFCRVAAW